MVRAFRASHMRWENFLDFVKKKYRDLNPTKPTSDVATRWGSVLDMIMSVLKFREVRAQIGPMYHVCPHNYYPILISIFPCPGIRRLPQVRTRVDPQCERVQGLGHRETHPEIIEYLPQDRGRSNDHCTLNHD